MKHKCLFGATAIATNAKVLNAVCVKHLAVVKLHLSNMLAECVR